MDLGLVSAKEAARMMGVTPTRFLEMQDCGKVTPRIIDNRAFYDPALLFNAMRFYKNQLKPNPFPRELYATPKEAFEILQVCKKTFYSRVNAGQIKIHKQGKYSFIARKELYTTDELF